MGLFFGTANKRPEDAPEMQVALTLDLFGKGYDWLHPRVATPDGLGSNFAILYIHVILEVILGRENNYEIVILYLYFNTQRAFIYAPQSASDVMDLGITSFGFLK